MKNNLIIKVAYLFFALFLGVQLGGNAQVVSFVKYGVENGLIQSQVQSIEQDLDGRLWVGTISGISVYNGVEFKNYTTIDSLAENWVTKIFRSKNGDMWMGHWAGSITRWSYNTNEFENMKIERFNEFQTITDFVEDTVKGNIIFSSNGTGVFLYHVDKNEVTKIEYSESLESKYVVSIYLHEDRDLWVCTENDGIYIFNLDQVASNKASSRHLDENAGLSSNRVVDISFYNNKYWIATADKGVDVFASKTIEDFISSNIEKVKGKNYNAENEGKDKIIESIKISSFAKDAHGSLWIGTIDKGVYRITQKGEEDIHNVSYNTREGLSFYDINCIFSDREKSVWLGTNVGLNQYISDYFLLFDKSIGLPNNIVQAIASDGQGNIWLGTNSGISKLENGANPQSEDIRVQQVLINGLEKTPIRDIFRDKDNNLWIANAQGMLFKRKPSGEFEKINIENVLRDVIFSITEDDNGNLWLGTKNGAARFNKATYKLDFFTEEDGLGGRNVSKVIKDKKGNLWFACSGGNLTMYDGNSFTTFGEADSVKPFILCVEADNQGNIYFGAYTGGLYKYDGKQFTNYTNQNSNLRTETPYALIADDENNIWIGTSYGVEKFDPRDESFVHYGKTEGFLGLEVNYNAVGKDENENIWFGTILGAVRYNPQDDFENDVKPIIKVESLEINQEPAEFPFNSTFSPNENELTFNFIGVSLNNSNKVRYQYVLSEKGKEAEWTKPSSAGNAYFSNIDPGKYEFKVKALNSFNIESEEFIYPFEVKVPWYMALWFYALQVGVVILMLIFAIFYGRSTGGSRTATVLATIALIIIFEYGINYVEDSVEDDLGGVVFIKVGLNVILAIILFPIEEAIKKIIVSGARQKRAATNAAKSSE